MRSCTRRKSDVLQARILSKVKNGCWVELWGVPGIIPALLHEEVARIGVVKSQVHGPPYIHAPAPRLALIPHRRGITTKYVSLSEHGAQAKLE